MNRSFALLCLVLFPAQVFAADPAGPFAKGNKAIGQWKQVMTGKLSPFSEEKSTQETTLTSTPAINGWYIETSSTGWPGMSTSLMSIEPDGKSLKLWSFAQNNVLTMAGTTDGTLTRLSGTDQYGGIVELSDKWIDDDHREGRFTLKSKDGVTLIDLIQKVTRVGK